MRNFFLYPHIQQRRSLTLVLFTGSIQFTAKQLNRQAARAGKDETAEKNKLKKVRPHNLLPLPPLATSTHITPSYPGNPAKPPRHRQNLRPKRHP